MATRKTRKTNAARMKAKFAQKAEEQKAAAGIGPKLPAGWTPPAENNAIEKKVRRATKNDSQTALQWFFNEIKGEIGQDGRAKSRIRRIPDKAFRPGRDPFIGQVFFFIYDAKWKDELPYWDQFPMVIPVSLYNDGFLGLNLHYLPPVGRAKLLDMLQKFKRFSATPRAYMKVSYNMLKYVVTHKMFAPCVHRYLTSHIKSNLVKVMDEYWDRAAMLPVQKFVGASAKDVWSGRAGPQTRRKKRK